jgi:hypothetical protein
MQPKLSDYHKRQIAAAMRPLREGVSLDHVLSEIESAAQKFWRRANLEEKMQAELHGDTLLITWARTETLGRPRKDALRAYVTAVGRAYERATARYLGRCVFTDSKNAKLERQLGRNIDVGDRENYHPFLLACLGALGMLVGPTKKWGYKAKAVRDGLHELHPNAKPGRPPKR